MKGSVAACEAGLQRPRTIHDTSINPSQTNSHTTSDGKTERMEALKPLGPVLRGNVRLIGSVDVGARLCRGTAM